MRSRRLSWWWLAASVLFACSSSNEPAVDTPEERVSTVQAAVVGECTTKLFGHPCSNGSSGGFDSGTGANECANVCWADGNGVPACVSVFSVGMTPQSLNGRVCGASGESCNNTCLNGACLAIPASPGTACQPSGFATTCEGSCQPGEAGMTCKSGPGTDAGASDAGGPAACPFGASGCVFHACDMLNVTVCKTFDVLPGSQCNDFNACTTFDYCDNGSCTGIFAKNCDDGNVCTTDTCIPSTGACIGFLNQNPCSDGDPCTIGDVCSVAVCQPGSPVPGCDAGAGGTGGFGGFDASFGGFGGFDASFGGFGGIDSGFGGFGGFDSGFGGFGGSDASFGGSGGFGGNGGKGGGFDSGPDIGGFGGSGGLHDGASGGAGAGGVGGAKDGGNAADGDGVRGGCGCYLPNERKPEPVSWLVLMAAVAGVLRRRRRAASRLGTTKGWSSWRGAP